MNKISGQGDSMEIECLSTRQSGQDIESGEVRSTCVEVPLDAQYPIDVDGHTILVPRVRYVEGVLQGGASDE